MIKAQTLQILIFLIIVALAPQMGIAQSLEEAAEASQQRLLNEAIRASAIRNARAVAAEDAGRPAELALKKRAMTEFTVGLFQDFLYESNARLDSNSGEGSFSYSPTVLFRANTKLNDEFRVESSANWSSTWYSDIEDRDFWGLAGRVMLNYRPFQKWPEFYAGPELNRFEAWEGGDEISKSVSAVAGFRNNVQVYPGGSVFYNARYSHRWIDPSQFERDQVNVIVGLTHRLGKGFFLQPSYSFGWYNYEDDFIDRRAGGRVVDREDLRHEVALALIYRLNDHFTFRLSGSFVDHDSSLTRANYQNFSTGLNSGITYGF